MDEDRDARGADRPARSIVPEAARQGFGARIAYSAPHRVVLSTTPGVTMRVRRDERVRTDRVLAAG